MWCRQKKAAVTAELCNVDLGKIPSAENMFWCSWPVCRTEWNAASGARRLELLDKLPRERVVVVRASAWCCVVQLNASQLNACVGQVEAGGVAAAFEKWGAAYYTMPTASKPKVC